MGLKRPGPTPAGALLLASLLGACSSSKEETGAESESRSESARIERALARSPGWLQFHRPELSEGGYNLALYNRRVPFLMDMNGAVVHSWPDVRASGRARLLPTGHLTVITDRGHLREYDWEGRETWAFKSARSAHMLHHDFALLENGNYLLLIQRPKERADYLLEVDRSGDEVWRWESHEAIREDFWRSARANKTHINSVQELPPNPLFDQGHEAFRPGNILVSARNLNTLYIVARPGGEVVWRYSEGLDWQHEAQMVPAGFPRAGHILLFNNGYHTVERQSSILELDPLENSVAWSYRSPGFFSATEGTQQLLPKGNLLVTSSHGGRVFELTRSGEIVWQWVPPYPPVRVWRYPHDFSPQLEALTPLEERSVRGSDPEQFVDSDQYSFALHDVRHVPTGASSVVLLRETSQCRQLRLPEDAQLTVGYGIDRRKECSGAGAGRVRFGVSVQAVGDGSSVELLEREVGADAFAPDEPEGFLSLRRESFSLERFGPTVEICLSLTLASASGGPPPPCFVWEQPGIRPGEFSGARPFEEDKAAEVQEYERQQLEALGYIN